MGYDLWPVFTMGFMDSINPFWLATILFFVLFLSTTGHTRSRVIFIGLLFMVSAGMMQYLLVRGFGDHLLTRALILNVINYYYLLAALIFFIIGGLNLADWWGYKKLYNVDRFRLKLPVFLRRQEGKPKGGDVRAYLNMMKSLFLAVLAGMTFTFTASIAPQDEYIYILHSHLLANRDTAFVNGSYILYSLGFVIPLAVIWALIVGLTTRQEKGPVFISYYKGISAAVFLSTGLSLAYGVSKIL